MVAGIGIRIIRLSRCRKIIDTMVRQNIDRIGIELHALMGRRIALQIKLSRESRLHGVGCLHIDHTRTLLYRDQFA